MADQNLIPSRDEYLTWRAPRRGTSNPERLTNPAWAWLAQRPHLSAYEANERFHGPRSTEAGPAWCAMRYGQSHSLLADGRAVAIGGEHEDHSDADFFIYNDVIVSGPDGALEIFGYPVEVFPPTDFHTATVTRDRVIVIGCLGYPHQRRRLETPVFALDTHRFAFSALATTGAAPGWISRHTTTAGPDGDLLTLKGGEVIDTNGRLRPNSHDWTLRLSTLAWERSVTRRWREFELTHEDGSTNVLWKVRSAWWQARAGGGATPHGLELAFEPELSIFEHRYRPPFDAREREAVAGDEATYEVDGLVARWRESPWSVHLVVEGELDDVRANAWVEAVLQRLARLDGARWQAVELPPP